MIIETSAMLSFFLITSLARVEYPQGDLIHSLLVGTVALCVVVSTVLAFSYATGTTLTILGTQDVTFSNWMLRMIVGAYPANEKHTSDYHQLKGVQYYYDFLRMVAIWFCQFLGAYAGTLIAILFFLQGQTNEFYSIAELMTPKLGVATWLSGSLQITPWQASIRTFLGSFIIHSALLYVYGLAAFHKKKVWAALFRGFSYFLTFVLFYGSTGAAVDWLMWLVPASLTMSKNGYPSSEVSIVYLLSPFLGSIAAALFFWFWVWIVKATGLDKQVIVHGGKKSETAPTVVVPSQNQQAQVVSSALIQQQLASMKLGKGIGDNVALH
jgi:hypothetical protein